MGYLQFLFMAFSKLSTLDELFFSLSPFFQIVCQYLLLLFLLSYKIN